MNIVEFFKVLGCNIKLDTSIDIETGVQYHVAAVPGTRLMFDSGARTAFQEIAACSSETPQLALAELAKQVAGNTVVMANSGERRAFAPAVFEEYSLPVPAKVAPTEASPAANKNKSKKK